MAVLTATSSITQETAILKCTIYTTDHIDMISRAGPDNSALIFFFNTTKVYTGVKFNEITAAAMKKKKAKQTIRHGPLLEIEGPSRQKYRIYSIQPLTLL